jgi:DNA-binding NtrC family response regulator
VAGWAADGTRVRNLAPRILGRESAFLGRCTRGKAAVEKCRTLMIAERGSTLVEALDPWLADQGYEVKLVDNMRDALITLQSEKVHVLVMDVCMAENIGYEAISIIKGLCKNLPIIVTTDENNPQMESSIRQKGIFYYHVKSFGMDELMLAISNAMTRATQMPVHG